MERNVPESSSGILLKSASSSGVTLKGMLDMEEEKQQNGCVLLLSTVRSTSLWRHPLACQIMYATLIGPPACN